MMQVIMALDEVPSSGGKRGKNSSSAGRSSNVPLVPVSDSPYYSKYPGSGSGERLPPYSTSQGRKSIPTYDVLHLEI